MKGRGGERSIRAEVCRRPRPKARDMPITGLRDILHGQGKEGREMIWDEADQTLRSRQTIVLVERMNTLAFFILFWRAEHGTAVVSHLEKVPRHVVSWELSQPTLSMLSKFFLKCSLFSHVIHSMSKAGKSDWKQIPLWKKHHAVQNSSSYVTCSVTS